MIAYTKYNLDARVRREAESLARDSGYEITVLSLKQDFLPRHYISNGVAVKELNIEKYRGKSRSKYLWTYLKFMWLAWMSCTKRFVQAKIDIVHVHNMPNFLIFSAILPRLFGKKLILDIHDSMPETFSSKFTSFSKLFFKMLCVEEKICCALAHKIICVNHVQKEVLSQRGIPDHKMFISMNAPDHNIFNPSKMKQCSSSNGKKFKIVYHGTITRRLGVDLVIHALALLGDKIPNSELHIWGEGELLSECIELSKKSDVKNKVFFHGTVDSHSLPEILSEMDLGVVANRQSEATEMMLPVKMLEYVALGIPVVGPKLRGINYYFSDGMLSYFEAGDVDSLARAILKLFENEELRKIQAKQAKMFLDRYGWKKQEIEYKRFYEGLGR